MSEESPEDRQKNALDSARKKILKLEQFLEKTCPAKMKDLIAQWQYETGQAPRKTKEYLNAIKAAGKIGFFEKDNDDDWWVFVRDHNARRLGKERPTEVLGSENEQDPELNPDSDTPFTDWSKKEMVRRIANKFRLKQQGKIR